MYEKGRGVLFTGGEGPQRKFLEAELENALIVAAADSGWDLASSMGLAPELVVGDMDSIVDRGILNRLSRDRVVIFDREKDETDTEIGIRLLFERGITDITLVGGGGGRLDHLIGILALFDRERRPRRWYTAREEVTSVDANAVFTGMRDRVCSFFPAGSEICTMRTTGLRWPLDNLAWKRGDVGISNYGLEDRVTVEMKSGRLIVVRELREEPYG